MTDEVEPLNTPSGATGEGGAASPAESLPQMSEEYEEEGADLWEFLEQCTPEGKWFLKVLQHFNSKLEDRAEVRVYKDSREPYLRISTHKSEFILKATEDTLYFSFTRKRIVDTEYGVRYHIGSWVIPISSINNGKKIIDTFFDVFMRTSDLEDILKGARILDRMIREEKAKVAGKEVRE
ncbi:hypothetical protein [Candidatus Korarchaeum cryptofilum]|nr:hypothetical protein [Candidatus Korarchaeum cryptofilum]